MARIAPSRELAMAQKGYVSATTAAKALDVHVATLCRMSYGNLVEHMSMSGMIWFKWDALVAHYNKINVATDGSLWSDIMSVSKNAIDAYMSTHKAA